MSLKTCIATPAALPAREKGRQQKPQTKRHGAEVTGIKAGFQAAQGGCSKPKTPVSG